jgi:hypothetical protein
MKPDALKQFVTLRDSLTKEKAQLEARLAAINQALGTNGVGDSARADSSQADRGTRGVARRPRTRPGGGVTLREAVTKLTSARPLTKKEIVAALPTTGYKTKSTNPANLLNALFYGKNAAFKNVDGKFSPR